MAEQGYNVSPTILPSLFGSPAGALQQAIGLQERNKERQYEIDYRNKKEAESDQWRKLNLINDLTDLSKHQTGSDVANALGNKLMTDIYQKYTTNADKMSPVELQANIQRDMSGIIGGMDNIKNELALTDEQMKAIKQHYPSVDTASLYSDLRKDVVNRHLNNNADAFKNPMEIGQSNFDLTNPEVLSRYVTNTKGLDEGISNPKGLDPITAVTGDPYTNVEFSGKMPYWMKPNFTPEQMKNGFLPKGFTPKLEIKSENLPSEFLPALKNNPRKMVTSDVHDQFMAEHPLEVIAGTKSMFPNYDRMNEGEKNIAQRDYLYTKIQALDKSGLNYKSSKTPSASMIKLWTGGSGSSDQSELRNIYKEINDKTELNRTTPGKGHGYPLNQLSATAQKTLVDYAKKITGKDVGQADIYVKKEDNGTINLMSYPEGKVIAPIDFGDVNLPVQVGVKEKREVIRRNEQPQVDESGYTRAELKSAGWSDEQIRTASEAGKISLKKKSAKRTNR